MFGTHRRWSRKLKKKKQKSDASSPLSEDSTNSKAEQENTDESSEQTNSEEEENLTTESSHDGTENENTETGMESEMEEKEESEHKDTTENTDVNLDVEAKKLAPEILDKETTNVQQNCTNVVPNNQSSDATKNTSNEDETKGETVELKQEQGQINNELQLETEEQCSDVDVTNTTESQLEKDKEISVDEAKNEVSNTAVNTDKEEKQEENNDNNDNNVADNSSANSNDNEQPSNKQSFSRIVHKLSDPTTSITIGLNKSSDEQVTSIASLIEDVTDTANTTDNKSGDNADTANATSNGNEKENKTTDTTSETTTNETNAIDTDKTAITSNADDEEYWSTTLNIDSAKFNGELAIVNNNKLYSINRLFTNSLPIINSITKLTITNCNYLFQIPIDLIDKHMTQLTSLIIKHNENVEYISASATTKAAKVTSSSSSPTSAQKSSRSAVSRKPVVLSLNNLDNLTKLSLTQLFNFTQISFTQLTNLERLSLVLNNNTKNNTITIPSTLYSFAKLTKLKLKLMKLNLALPSKEELQEIQNRQQRKSLITYNTEDAIINLIKIKESQFNLTELILCKCSLAHLNTAPVVDEIKLSFSFADSSTNDFSCLPHLTNLELNSNDITLIPTSVFSLIKLTRLVIINNEICNLSPDFSKLTSLKYLQLANLSVTNLNIEDDNSKCILENCHKLTSLKITNSSIASFPLQLLHSSLSNLQELILCNNQLSQFILSEDNTSNDIKLMKLNLSHNKISIIPEDISLYTYLTTLLLCGNQISTIPDSFSSLEQLEKLSLSMNEFASVPNATINNLTNLILLDFSYNNITTLCATESTTEDAKNTTSTQVPFAALSKLKELDLSFNKLEESSISVFTHLTSLTKLNLNDNNFKNFESIDALSQLIELHINSNDITTLPSSIGTLTNLQQLSVADLQLTTIPQPLMQLQSLTTLNINSNNITQLPDSLHNLSKLENIQFASNCLNNISDSCTSLGNLQILFLGKDELSNNERCNSISSINPSIKVLRHLTMLNLDGNCITELPDSITQLTHLVNLSIENNELSTFPLEICSLTNLKYINLNNNKVTNIPSNIMQLSRLQSLWLANNQLSLLSRSICSCARLVDVDFADNPLTILSFAKLLRLVKVYSTNINISGCSAIKLLPQHLKQASIKEIFTYAQSLITNASDTCWAKLLVLGQQQAGKTSLIEALANHKSKDGYLERKLKKFKKSNATVGIQLSNIGINNKGIQFWDFSGSTIYQSAHLVFMHQLHNSLILFLWNATEPIENSQLDSWLPTIFERFRISKYQHPAFVLGITHAEKQTDNAKAIQKLTSYFSRVTTDYFSPVGTITETNSETEATFTLNTSNLQFPSDTEIVVARILNCVVLNNKKKIAFYNSTNNSYTTFLEQLEDYILQLTQSRKNAIPKVMAEIKVDLETTYKSSFVLSSNEFYKRYATSKNVNIALRYLTSIGIIYWNNINTYCASQVILQNRWIIELLTSLFVSKHLQGKKKDALILSDIQQSMRSNLTAEEASQFTGGLIGADTLLKFLEPIAQMLGVGITEATETCLKLLLHHGLLLTTSNNCYLIPQFCSSIPLVTQNLDLILQHHIVLYNLPSTIRFSLVTMLNRFMSEESKSSISSIDYWNSDPTKHNASGCSWINSIQDDVCITSSVELGKAGDTFIQKSNISCLNNADTSCELRISCLIPTNQVKDNNIQNIVQQSLDILKQVLQALNRSFEKAQYSALKLTALRFQPEYGIFNALQRGKVNNCSVIPVNNNSEEFATLSSWITKANKDISPQKLSVYLPEEPVRRSYKHFPNLNLVHAFKVDNEPLFQQFVTARNEVIQRADNWDSLLATLHKDLPQSSLEDFDETKEHLLLHGTDSGAMQIIIQHGFDTTFLRPQYVLGKGHYFTDNIGYATNFSKCTNCYSQVECISSCLEEEGLFYVLISRVATGKIQKMGKAKQHFDAKSYNSALCQANNGADLCVYTNAQAYPQYILLLSKHNNNKSVIPDAIQRVASDQPNLDDKIDQSSSKDALIAQLQQENGELKQINAKQQEEIEKLKSELEALKQSNT